MLSFKNPVCILHSFQLATFQVFRSYCYRKHSPRSNRQHISLYVLFSTCHNNPPPTGTFYVLKGKYHPELVLFLFFSSFPLPQLLLCKEKGGDLPMCLMWKFHLPSWPSFRAGVVTGQALCVPNHFSCGLTFGPRISLSTGEETEQTCLRAWGSLLVLVGDETLWKLNLKRREVVEDKEVREDRKRPSGWAHLPGQTRLSLMEKRRVLLE